MSENELTKVLNKPFDSFINPEIYNELVKLAKYSLRNISNSNTLNTSDVINNAVLKIYNHKSGHFQSRGHFFSLMTQIMRNLVIDHARKKQAEIHGGNCEHVTLSHLDDDKKMDTDLDQLLDIDKSIENLSQSDKLLEQIIVMRFYGGVELKEIAECFKLSESTVKRKIRFAKAIMKTYLSHN